MTYFRFGRDSPGSYEYLLDTLTVIRSFRDCNILEPLTVSDDGDCLLMALSRALVGREVFWNPLSIALSKHLTKYETRYRTILDEFLVEGDWEKVANFNIDDFVLNCHRLSK